MAVDEKTKKGAVGVGNVIDFAKVKARRARQFVDQGEQVVRPLEKSMDEATRDLHAAASSTMKLVQLARARLGLPDL